MSEDMQISSMSFEDGGVAIAYMARTDVRDGGRLAQHHVLFLSAAHPDYRDDILGLHRKALRMLDNALEDFKEAPVFELDDEDDEGKGMGDH